MSPPGQLVTLGVHHAAVLETFLKAFDGNPDELHGYFCPRNATIQDAVHALDAWGRGEEIKAGWVPCSTWFWSVNDELQGVINLRHWLNPGLEETFGHIGYCVAPGHRRKGIATAMLKAVLPKCRRLGLDRVLLTCDLDNLGSISTIEANGGVFHREAWLNVKNGIQRWYWIDLSPKEDKL